MVESSEIIQRPKHICRGRGRRRGRGSRGRGGRCSHHSEVSDIFSLECCAVDDVLLEVLARLPLKSIFRFKCVSKRWYQLISKDYFRAKIIERNKMDPGPLYFFQTPKVFDGYRFVHNILTEEEGTIRKLTLSFLVETKKTVTNSSCVGNNKFGVRVKVEESDIIINGGGIGIGNAGDHFRSFICSSNGLLLCLVSHWIKSPLPWACPIVQENYSWCVRSYRHVIRYYIYNPLTKLGYLLPYSLNQTHRLRKSHDKTEPCECSERDCVALLVGSTSTDDNHGDDGYKVVCVQASLSNENIIEVETFSSHTGEWQLSTVTVSVDTRKSFSIYSRSAVSFLVIKGAIYWMLGLTSFAYVLVYNDTDHTNEEERNDNPAGVIEMIKGPLNGCLFSTHARMVESIDGLLQVAGVVKQLVGDEVCYFTKIWVYHPQQDCRWLLRHQLEMPYFFKFHTRFLEQVVISFHPLNPNILLIHWSGWIFACHLNTTSMLTEPLVRFTLLEKKAIIYPYLPPPWPISPFPAAAQKKIDS